MSMMRCEKHDIEYDSDYLEQCIECEEEIINNSIKMKDEKLKGLKNKLQDIWIRDNYVDLKDMFVEDKQKEFDAYCIDVYDEWRVDQ